MTKAAASAGIPTTQVADLQALQWHLRELAHEADAATRLGDRSAGIGYAAIFIALPFVVVLFRLQMDPWHYYLAGALFLVGAVATHAMELVTMTRHDQAMQAMQRAREAYAAARGTQPSATPAQKTG